MSLVHNERVKLTATLLNNVSVATLATAVIAPTANFLYGNGAAPGRWWLIGGVWFAAGACLHLLARATLGRLKA